jgi:uncharacterized protein
MISKTKALPSTDQTETPPAGGRRIVVKRSGVHGKGVYATQPIAGGDVVIEYKGEIIDWPEALRRHPHDPQDPHHTFYFHLDDEYVIDGKVRGNAARWINHACQPNCEADQIGMKVFIKAKRNIKPGEELFSNVSMPAAVVHRAVAAPCFRVPKIDGPAVNRK